MPVTKYTALEEKTSGMRNVVNDQADGMVRKLHAATVIKRLLQPSNGDLRS